VDIDSNNEYAFRKDNEIIEKVNGIMGKDNEII
jgi:hypothetical protein